MSSDRKTAPVTPETAAHIPAETARIGAMLEAIEQICLVLEDCDGPQATVFGFATAIEACVESMRICLAAIDMATKGGAA